VLEPLASVVLVSVTLTVAPVGKVMVAVTPLAVLGPLLMTVTVPVTVVPGTALAGKARVTLMSTSGLAVMVAVLMLLLGVGSGVVLVTLAVLVIRPEALLANCTTSVTVAVALAAKLATLAVTWPVLVFKLSPPDWLALSKVTPAGKTSLTVTFCATLGPALLTTMV
jgi:hypothetical protein